MCTNLCGLIATLALVAFVSGVAQPSAMAAQAGQAQAGQVQAQKAEMAKGELRAVDSAKRTLTISAGGKDQVFHRRR